MKLNDGIKVFYFGIGKVWKIVFENVWEPCISHLCLIKANMQFGIHN